VTQHADDSIAKRPFSLHGIRVEHAWIASVVLGVLVRLIGVIRPLNQPSWRQGDLVAMARGFARESLNPFSPRIAWRGTSSGIVESEFPLVSWTTGVLWKVTGEYGWMIRVVPFIAGTLTLVVFGRFALETLGRRAGWLAVAVMALNPLTVFTSVAAQSDAVMLLGIVVAVSAAWRWQSSEKPRLADAVVVCVGLVLAGTMKLTGLHVGVAVAAIIVAKKGWRGLLRRDVLVVGAVSLVLSGGWAAAARSNYNKTGLSLGISNERHWAGLDLVREPGLVLGMVRHELRYVWLLFGLVLAGLAVAKRHREPIIRTAVVWLVGVGAMLLVAGRTTGDNWAFYYHLAAVPPAALLIGAGLETGWTWSGRRAKHMTAGPSSIVLVCLAALTLLLGVRSSWQLSSPQSDSALYTCAKQFDNRIGTDDLILTSGGTRLDSGGHRVAYDASYMFEWTDSMGWTIALEDQSAAAVSGYAALGAQWFILERDALATLDEPSQQELVNSFVLADDCQAAMLLDLRRP
jgi:hypothetical protein